MNEKDGAKATLVSTPPAMPRGLAAGRGAAPPDGRTLARAVGRGRLPVRWEPCQKRKITRIVVAEGFNPRGEVVEDTELQAMAATMSDRDCLQPIRVRATETGDFALIAGERRYRAATLAALTTLPAVVLTGGAGDEGEYLDLLADERSTGTARGLVASRTSCYLLAGSRP